MCSNAAVNGVSKDGGYAEYCTLRSEATVTIDRSLDPAAAAPLLCAGVTLFNSIRKMGITQGDTVAIQGLGGLGHLGVQYARKMGYRTVALSSSDKKRDFATKLGANDYFDGSKQDHGEALQKIGGAALIVVTAPNPEIISPLLNGLAAGGKLLILAPVGEVKVNTVAMITKGLSVHGWPSGHALDSEEAIQFAQHHDVNCKHDFLIFHCSRSRTDTVTRHDREVPSGRCKQGLGAYERRKCPLQRRAYPMNRGVSDMHCSTQKDSNGNDQD